MTSDVECESYLGPSGLGVVLSFVASPMQLAVLGGKACFLPLGGEGAQPIHAPIHPHRIQVIRHGFKEVGFTLASAWLLGCRKGGDGNEYSVGQKKI
jgi:hypothetical protein